MKKWSDLTKEERARVIQWLRQDVAGEAVDQELRDAAAEELERPTWAEETDECPEGEPAW